MLIKTPGRSQASYPGLPQPVLPVGFDAAAGAATRPADPDARAVGQAASIDAPRRKGVLFSLAALLVALAGLGAWLLPEMSTGAGAPMAPDLSIRVPGQEPILLGSLRGRVVLVSFWGATCQHCARQQPAVTELQRALGERGFVSIGVGSGGEALAEGHHHPANEPAGARMVSGMPLTLDAGGDLARALGADQRLPSHVLIDRQGRIVARLQGDVSPALLQGRVSELMASR